MKRIVFKVRPYDANGQAVVQLISPYGAFRGTALQTTGPYEGRDDFNETEWEAVWRNTTIECLEIIDIEVDYTDGTSRTYSKELPQLLVEGFTNSCKGIKKAGGFVPGSDGTITDNQTGLMWAAQDNGHDVTWDEAKQFCEKYKGGGHSDWRMPTSLELRSLYDESNSRTLDCDPRWPFHAKPPILLSCHSVWSCETEGPVEARYFYFVDGFAHTEDRSASIHYRALPVRSQK
ncbi:MAG: DUF1566 domain-containing protein [Acidobacteriota bacterium]